MYYELTGDIVWWTNAMIMIDVWMRLLRNMCSLLASPQVHKRGDMSMLP